MRKCIKCEVEKENKDFHKYGVYQNNICIKCGNKISLNNQNEKRNNRISKNVKNSIAVKNFKDAQKEKIEVEILRQKWYTDHNSITFDEANKIAEYDYKMYLKPFKLLVLKTFKSKL